MKERMALIDNGHPLSIRRQAQILSVNRSQLYYPLAGEKSADAEENLALMEVMDKIFLSDPTLGVLGMQDELAEKGMNYNVKRIRSLLRKMTIEPIYRHGPPRQT
ncbi:transposase [Dyadobacter sp. 676]|uniref:Transposase n=1 Tax=Dyadobacter sp. 676 TaxID=3088362 RepID=A0AAU8FLS8_9BACT